MRKSLTFFSLLLAGIARADEASTCHDEATRAEWRAIAAKHAEDDDWQAMHALWLGLCAKVDAGEMTEFRAGALFERERARLVAKQRANPLPPVERWLTPQG
jgi:hypothetical protein